MAIVLRDEDGVEEGLYVSIPISSYAPMVGDRFAVLEKLSETDDRTFGTLIRDSQALVVSGGTPIVTGRGAIPRPVWSGMVES